MAKSDLAARFDRILRDFADRSAPAESGLAFAISGVSVVRGAVFAAERGESPDAIAASLNDAIGRIRAGLSMMESDAAFAAPGVRRVLLTEIELAEELLAALGNRPS